MNDFLLRIGISIGLFAALNAAIIGCQEIASVDPKKEYKAMKSKADKLQAKINRCKANERHLSSFEADQCNRAVRSFNAMVPDLNSLNKKVNSRFYLIPIPRRAARAAN